MIQVKSHFLMVAVLVILSTKIAVSRFFKQVTPPPLIAYIL